MSYGNLNKYPNNQMIMSTSSSVGQKKIYRLLEIALSQVPPEQWASSLVVSKALLDCTRIKGIVRQFIRKSGVSPSFTEEIISDVALVMQTHVFCNGLGEGKGQIAKIEDVYFVVYKVVGFTVSNYRKKITRTALSPEENFSETRFSDETYEQMMGRLTDLDWQLADNTDVEDKIDTKNAQQHFTQKLLTLGWPSFIPRTRSIGRGRPSNADKMLRAAANKSLED
jgi:hypothetical protein